MLVRSEEDIFEDAKVKIFKWVECPDGEPEETSHFHKGYVEVHVFGTGEDPLMGFQHWQILFAWPKYDAIVFSKQADGFIVVMVDSDCVFRDIEIGIVKFRPHENATKHPVVIANFTLPCGDIVKKFVAINADGDSVEIPDETLH